MIGQLSEPLSLSNQQQLAPAGCCSSWHTLPTVNRVLFLFDRQPEANEEHRLLAAWG